MPLISSVLDQITPNVVADVAITSLLLYWLFSLIRGTRAVRLVIGVALLFLVYGAALFFDLKLLTVILQSGAYVGLFALVVIFQPELRRALDRIGRLGSVGRLIAPADQARAIHVATEVAAAADRLSREGHGALMVIERETGLQEIAETGVTLDSEITADLLVTIFSPRTPLHDGAVVIRGDRILAAGALLPSAETTIPIERFGTRHKAALGMTEQTDAVVVVVSEETGQISLVERARIKRNLDEPKLARAVALLIHPQTPGEFLRSDGGMPKRVGPTVRELARRARFGRINRDRAATAASAAAAAAAGGGSARPRPTTSTEPAVTSQDGASADGAAGADENGTSQEKAS